MLTFNTKTDKFLCELVKVFFKFKKTLIDQGYADELEWQRSREIEKISESDFLGEAAWVILSTGMSTFVVERLYPKISEAYYWWSSASKVVETTNTCEERSFVIFRNKRKIKALSQLCIRVHQEGFDEIKNNLKKTGPSYLSSFSYIGPITSLHLAKNLGIDVVKPDRHLVRIAQAVGFNTPHDLCSKVAEITGEKLSVIDLTLWRYATLHHDYLKYFEALI